VTIAGVLAGAWAALLAQIESSGSMPGPVLLWTALSILAAIALPLMIAAVGLSLWRLELPFKNSKRPQARLYLEDDPEGRFIRYSRWLVSTRWRALALALLLILLAVPILRVLPQSTLAPLLALVICHAAVNIGFARWVKDGREPELQILVQCVADLIVLTALLHFSGGLENPLFMLYILYAILPAFLLRRKHAFALTIFTGVLFTSVVFGESIGALRHFDNQFFHHVSRGVEASTGVPIAGIGGAGPPDLLFVFGRVVPFVAVLAMTSLAVTTIAGRVRRTEQDLQHRQLEELMEKADIGIIVLDANLRIQWHSSRAATNLGWQCASVDRPCAGAASSRPCRGECVARLAVISGQATELERDFVDENGRQRCLRIAASPILNEQGGVVQVVELIEEITEQKELERKSLHNLKLSALGTLAAGIAHEIGNPLSSLRMRLRLMETKKDPMYVDQSLEVLNRQIGGLERIVRDVSDFVRPDRSERVECDLREVLDEAIGIVRFDPKAKRVTIRESHDGASFRVLGVRDQLRQVFLNLLLNAIHVTSDGGSVEVSVTGQNGTVHAAVSDTGPGMDEDVRRRLFEPFFTTKRDGSGLGLAISQSLIRAHGGRINVDSEPGRGSRFVVDLPAA
jgi:PAS domain S-box-containing protein